MRRPLFILLTTLSCVAAIPALAGETTNRIGITMVDIPAGSFVMGSCLPLSDKERFMGKTATCGTPGPEASSEEGPQHRVMVRAFQMGKTEVTLGQFKKFIGAADRSDLVDDGFMKYNAHGDNAPVVQVSWHDAQAFIDWLNKTDGGGYRLPSEAEWEYACRAGEGRRFCTNADDLSGGAWWDNNSGGHQHNVATKRGNAFGLYDMSGNVWEWVQDCWHDSYRGAPSDGSAWTNGCNGEGRGLRGGSWGGFARGTRAAIRGNGSPGSRDSNSGFRLARTR